MPSSRDVRDLLLPGFYGWNRGVAGRDIVVQDNGDITLKLDGRSHMVASRQEIEDGSYKGYFRNRLYRILGPKDGD